jgi:beta-lactam-binding protein with PASTA domain
VAVERARGTDAVGAEERGEARDRGGEAGLEPFVTTERGSRAAEPGSVVATRPVAGALVTHGSRVGLTVSRALIMRRGNGQP